MSIVCSYLSAGEIDMNTETEKQIGKNIKELREKAGMTQDILSAKLQLRGCDITRSRSTAFVSGRNYSYKRNFKNRFRFNFQTGCVSCTFSDNSNCDSSLTLRMTNQELIAIMTL